MELCSYSIIWGSRRRRDARRLPNAIQVSRRGGDLGPAGRTTDSQRPTLGSRHWGNQPGLLHSRCPGPTRTCGAGLRPAAHFDRRRQLSGPLFCAAECPGGDQSPPRRLDTAPRRLDTAPRLPSVWAPGWGWGRYRGADGEAAGEEPSGSTGGDPPSPSSLTAVPGYLGDKCTAPPPNSVYSRASGRACSCNSLWLMEFGWDPRATK